MHPGALLPAAAHAAPAAPTKAGLMHCLGHPQALGPNPCSLHLWRVVSRAGGAAAAPTGSRAPVATAAPAPPAGAGADRRRAQGMPPWHLHRHTGVMLYLTASMDHKACARCARNKAAALNHAVPGHAQSPLKILASRLSAPCKRWPPGRPCSTAAHTRLPEASATTQVLHYSGLL